MIDNVNQQSYSVDREAGNVIMAKVPTQVRINPEIKKQANALFKSLGLDMSTAVNLFLFQCILRGGLPFPVENPIYNVDTMGAMADAIRISKDPDVKGCKSVEELEKELLKD